MTITYDEFLREKVNFDTACGFDVDESELHPLLKPHQRDIVRWAVKGGRRAIFGAFGLGKSIMQLETVRLTMDRINPTAAAGLIVCPLGVRIEFKADARKLGMDVRFIRRTEEFDGQGIYLTNYESIRDGRLDPTLFDVVSLDEASVLRSYGSKTYQTFLSLFDGVPYRFVATATPAPNRYKELIHYAGYLGVMDTGQALTRFFQRDSTQANNLTLYPHKRDEFHLWLNTWAAFVQSPADLGHDATGYDLPELDVQWHEVDPALDDDPQVDRDGQGHLVRGVSLSLKDAATEKRRSLPARVERMKELINDIRRQGVPSAVLPAEPRTEAGGAARAGREEGPRGKAGISAGVLRGEPGQDPRPAEGAQPQELPAEQGGIRRPWAPDSTEDLRTDRGGLSADAGDPERPVRDMRDDTGSPEVGRSPALRGPRPQDGEGPRSAVPAVQLGAGHVRGRSGAATEGDRLPEQLIIWCHLNDEQRAIERALDEMGITYSSVFGSLDTDEVERRLFAWKSRETDVLIGKPIMLGQGMNLQQCHTCIYLGLDWSFNSLIQSVHRIQRFGQTHACTAHLIHSETEREVVQALRQKWTQHKELTSTMTEVIRTYGLDPDAIAHALTRAMGVERIEATGDGWTVANNDCVIETRDHMADNSVDLIVTSIPFSNHYEYTPNYNDFGHTDNNAHFWSQMDYLTPELLRVLKPGRVYACHVKDRINFGNVTGAGIPTVSPFHAEALFHGRKHGFDYMGMITVVTDVVRENNQTYRLGWSEQCKDGTKMGAGSPEYILLFHKPQTNREKGYADEPVTKEKANYSRARWQVDAHAFWRSSGDRPLTPDELAALPVEQRSRLFTKQTLQQVYDYETHISIGEQLEGRGALPATFMSLAPGSWHPDVWHDVNRMLTLNGDQKRRNLAMHVCPLQFDIVDRLIERYSNPGDLIYDPFGGLFTVPLRALRKGRRGRAAELNTGYFMDGVAHLKAFDREATMPSLFDLMGDAS